MPTRRREMRSPRSFWGILREAAPYSIPIPAWGNHYYGFFVQDDWRITRTLTLNFGGRWDYESPQTERYNRQNIGFDPAANSTFQVPGLPLKGRTAVRILKQPPGPQARSE